MQQQRLSDLKKTLQREFKVQALPNDDHFLHPPAGELSKSSSTPQGLNMLPDNYIHKPMFKNSQASLQQQMDMTMFHLVNSSSGRGGGGSNGSQRTGNHALEYNRDINFEYLRHVVLKFMLSRETEVSCR